MWVRPQDDGEAPILPCDFESGGDRSGSRIGSYVLERVLGTGATATVYAGRDASGEQVAIKLFHPVSQQVALYGQQEARIASRVVHPNLVHAREFGETEDGNFFIVMDLVHGEPLSSRRGHPQRWPLLVEIVLQVLDGLAALHQAGVVHRDVKPENVLVHEDARKIDVRVLDLGFAYSAVPLSVGPERSREVVGTRTYIAPELLGGARPTPAADVFSVGVILYELLTGQMEPEVLPCSRDIVVPSPQAFRPDLPPALCAVVLRALSDVKARFATATEMAVALKAIPDQVPWRRSLPVVALAFVGLLAALARGGAQTSINLPGESDVPPDLKSEPEESDVPPDPLPPSPHMTTPTSMGTPVKARKSTRTRGRARAEEARPTPAPQLQTFEQAMARAAPQARACAELAGVGSTPQSVQVRSDPEGVSVRVVNMSREHPFARCVTGVIREAALPTLGPKIHFFTFFGEGTP